MTYRIFDNMGASAEECSDIRKLLRENEISYGAFESTTVFARVGGLYVYTEKDYMFARKLIDQYQDKRRERFGGVNKPKGSHARDFVLIGKFLTMMLMVSVMFLVWLNL